MLVTLSDDLSRMDTEDKAATPGPWIVGEHPSEVVAPCPCCGPIATCVAYGPPSGNRDIDMRHHYNSLSIASARTDRPALVEMVRIIYERARTEAAERMALSMNKGERLQAEAAAREIDALFESLWAEAKKKAGGR